jgi:hypothetical protein
VGGRSDGTADDLVVARRTIMSRSRITIQSAAIVLGTLLGLALTAGKSPAVFSFVWNPIPRELVGKWVVRGGEQDGATFEFSRNGDMKGSLNVNGRKGIIKAQVWVIRSTLYSVTRNPETKETLIRSLKLRKLTAKDLVLETEQGEVFRMALAD